MLDFREFIAWRDGLVKWAIPLPSVCVMQVY